MPSSLAAARNSHRPPMTCGRIDLGHIEIARVMSAPVQVWGETPLDEVGELMMARRTDCIVVQGGHGVAGIFTSADAIAALTDLVRRATA